MLNYFNTWIIFLKAHDHSHDHSHDQGKQQHYLKFILCGLYCLVAVIILAGFGISALLSGNINYAFILLGFSIATLAGYSLLLVWGKYHLASHMVALLMAILCMYLFYSGGSDNTGALWYFIYPPLVIFLQDIRTGILSVVALMLATLIVYAFGLFGFDASRYSDSFIQRFIAVNSVILILSCLFAYFKNTAEEKLEEINKSLEKISATDELSNLVNRRKMEELLAMEVLRFGRFNQPFSIIMLDIDHFKNINDTYGHSFGDDVIRQLGEIFIKAIRRIDTASRWGGEEFLILLPGTTLKNARIVGERLRSAIANFEFHLKGHKVSISASLGLAQYREGGDTAECIDRADKCLYKAKAQGRNRVVTDDDPDPPGN